MTEYEERGQGTNRRWDSIDGPVAATFVRLTSTVSQLEERTTRQAQELRDARQAIDGQMREVRADIKNDLTSIQLSLKDLGAKVDETRSKLGTWQAVAWILGVMGMMMGAALVSLMNFKHVIG